MQNRQNIVVIQYIGNDLPDYIPEYIGNLLVDNGLALGENITITYLDQEDIKNALVKGACNIAGGANKSISIAVESHEDALQNALRYIGGRFEASLTNNKGNASVFAVKLASEYNSSKHAMLKDENAVALVNAVDIIATTHELIIPTNISRRYHITKQVAEVIKFVYNAFN